MKNVHQFFLVSIVFCCLIGCEDEKKLNTESTKTDSQVLLDEFVDSKYRYVYELRDEKFRHDLEYDIYANHVKERRSDIYIREPVVDDIEVKENFVLVSFFYSFSLDGERWRKTKDFLIWELKGDKFSCLDSGFRLFFPYNAPLRRPLSYEKIFDLKLYR